eukprot:3046660-Pleurochrysis_carterae.AAC.2
MPVRSFVERGKRLIELPDVTHALEQVGIKGGLTGETDGGGGRTALGQYADATHTLACRVVRVDRLQHALYVYSSGFAEMLSDQVAASSCRERLAGLLWGAFVLLLEKASAAEASAHGEREKRGRPHRGEGAGARTHARPRSRLHARTHARPHALTHSRTHARTHARARARAGVGVCACVHVHGQLHPITHVHCVMGCRIVCGHARALSLLPARGSACYRVRAYDPVLLRVRALVRVCSFVCALIYATACRACLTASARAYVP